MLDGFMRRVLATALGCCLMGCGEAPRAFEAQGDVEQHTVCNDPWAAVDVELYDGSNPQFSLAFVQRHEGAFGRHCSGSLIGPNLFLTVGHSSCPVEPGSSVGFNCQLSASDPTPPDPNAAATARCEWFTATSMVSYSASLDISVSTLSGDPGSVYGWVHPSPRQLEVGEPLALFQHPLGQGRRKMVGFDGVNSISATNMTYRIDSTGGSSGGGVMDRNGLLVGVHRAGGCDLSSGANKGVPMTYVFEQVPEVRNRVVAAWSAVL
jgi:hypothetical protein